MELTKLIRYDEWANREVLESLKKNSNPPNRSVQQLSHIFGAERLWLARLRSEKCPVPVWPEWSVGECEKQAGEISSLWKKYFGGLNVEFLSKKIQYVNSKGESFTSTVEEILTHVPFHSAYHRGQITSDLRAAGVNPPYTDFIHAVREGLLAQ